MDNDEITGGLPLFEVKGFQGKRFVSTPFRDRGGVLVRDGVDPAPLLQAAGDQCLKENANCVVVKEENPLPDKAWKTTGYQSVEHWTTTVVDLTPGAATLWEQLKNNAQGPVKQAEKLRVRLREGTALEDMRCFSRIFSVNRRALGVPVFQTCLFDYFYHLFCQKNKARLFLADTSRGVIAGILILIQGRTAIDGYAASLPQFSGMRANDFLVWKALEWSAENGFERFDFGADSPTQHNLLFFKRKWGGVHHVMPHYYYLHKQKTIDLHDSSSRIYGVARQCLSKLPPFLFRLFSKMIVSRLG